MKTDTDTIRLLAGALHSAAFEYVNATGTFSREAFGKMLGIQSATGCFDYQLSLMVGVIIDAVIDAKYAASEAARKVAA